MKIKYFGYGSLVNLETIPSDADVTPGKLQGWVREWRVCGIGENGQGRCALSVRKDPDKEIWGVMVREPRSRLPQLEQREKRYRKIAAVGSAFRCEAARNRGPDDLFMFVAAPEHHAWGDETHPILQSYLDCVLAGYFHVWGKDGIDHFLHTTEGWHVPVLRDRHRPVYPRSVSLPESVRNQIDEATEDRGLNFIDMP